LPYFPVRDAWLVSVDFLAPPLIFVFSFFLPPCAATDPLGPYHLSDDPIQASQHIVVPEPLFTLCDLPELLDSFEYFREPARLYLAFLFSLPQADRQD